MRRPPLSGLALVCAFGCQVDPVLLGPVEISHASGGLVDAGSLPTDAASPPRDAAQAQADAALVDAGAGDATADAGFTSVCELPTDAGAPTRLPMVVDEHFAPSGGAGDAARGALTTSLQCELPRQPDAQGNCYGFSYTPQPAASAGAASWAGLFFQYPVSNWGAQPGLLVAPGAQRVTFLAAGAQGGEIVTFRAGGIRDASGRLGCADDFTREMTVRLGTTFQRYEIDLQGVDYSRVISPFSWKISRVLFSGQTATPISFYLDDLRWE